MSFPPRAATSPELALFRTAGQKSFARAAIYPPTTIYTARVNQTFTTFDGVLEITYDGGTGTLADVLADMMLLVGSSAGAWDAGICRVRSIDATKVYISQTSDITWANDLYLTIVDDFGLWAKHVLISAGVPYMDGGIAYSDQHANMDPVPIMGGNRALKLTGATVSATFDWSHSYMPDGSSIASYATAAPGSSSSSGMTTNAPTISWNSVGWKKVFLTLTGTNGTTFFGVRYVYIWNDANPPARVELGENSQDVDTGGWSFSITMFDNCDLNDVRDHALVLLFSEDHYGSTQQEIGPLTGCENIVLTGWIAGEKINMNPERGLVEFTAYTAQYWFQQIPAYPDGVEFTIGAPTAWTEMQNLTVRLGLWHFLHWRTTATRIMDVFLPTDTKYTREVSSLAGNLWAQIQEMAFNQIFARAGVNRFNQLYIEVHPNLIPEADRSGIPVVMDIQKQDRVKEVNFDRVTLPEVAILDGSGVAVNASGVGTPYFSLAPGHTYPRFGSRESVDNILVASQADANTLFGLYRSWRNNELPDIPITFLANNRLIECCPNQYCTIDIDAADNVRGFAYDGKLIPTSVSFVFDAETGKMHTEASFEAETFEGLCVTGDYEGSGDVSVPPTPRLPPLPDFPIILPGIPTPTALGPTKYIFKDDNAGLIYVDDFDQTNPTTWRFVNGGLSADQYKAINLIALTPGGGIYVASCNLLQIGGIDSFPFIAYAPTIGGTFTIIEDETSLLAKFPGSTYVYVTALGVNPLNGQVAYVIGGFAGVSTLYIGTGTTFAAGTTIATHSLGSEAHQGSLTYGFGAWMFTGRASAGASFWKISADGSSVLATNTIGSDGYCNWHVRAGTTGKCFHYPMFDETYRVSTNNGASVTGIGSDINFIQANPNHIACDPTGMYLMTRWSTGHKGRSSDGGSTWAAMGSLPVPGASGWCFDYAGPGVSSLPRFVAGGATVYYSPDWGTTWYNRTGSLTGIVLFPAITIAKAVKF